MANTDIIDVDSETLEESNDSNKDRVSPLTNGPKSLVDLAKLTQPEMNVRVPFVDTLENNYIDCVMHFLVTVDLTQYTIATPYDHSVGICYEDMNGLYTFLTPGKAVTDEVFVTAGKWIESAFGEDLVLRNTPVTLTIMGDLEKYCKKGREKRLETLSSDDFKAAIEAAIDEKIDDEGEYDEEDAFFDELCLEHLGTDFKTLQKDAIQRQIDAEFDRIQKEAERDLAKELELDGAQQSDNEVVAEILTRFEHDSREYTLVRFLQPAVIVGKEDPDGLARQILLSPEENAKIMPRLEKMCADEVRNMASTLK